MSNTRKSTLVDERVNSTIANPMLPVALEDGHFASARVVRLIEIIRDKWPMLEVKWIPRELRGADEPAFLIVEKKDGAEFPIFYVKDEDVFDGTVIERLILSDSANGNVHDHVEAQNAAVKLIQDKLREDEREERLDIVRAAVKSPLHNYKIKDKEGKILKLDTHGGKILRGEVD